MVAVGILRRPAHAQLRQLIKDGPDLLCDLLIIRLWALQRAHAGTLTVSAVL